MISQVRKDMRIYDKSVRDTDGDCILEVEVDDGSYRHREVMGDDTLTLKFSLAEHFEIPVGAWCEFQGERYTLVRPEALTMHHSRSFEYTVTMEGPQWRAGIWKFRNTPDGRLSFSLTALPSEHLKMFVDNMNAREDEGEDTWEAGECVEHDEVCVCYDHAYCIEALGQMAEALDTEYEFGFETEGEGEERVVRKVVSLHKVEHGKDDPVALSYGRGNGFRPDVGRGNSSDSPPVEVLYAQGGSDNIDMSKYPQEVHKSEDPTTGEKYGGDGTGNNQNNNSSELLLPPGREIAYDGENFLYKGSDGSWGGRVLLTFRTYIVDEQGYSVRRSDRELESKAEDSLDCTDIYPKRVGVVAEVLETQGKDSDGNETTLYDFTDDAPGSCPDFNDYMIGSGPLTVIFQSGNLAGREFDVSYIHADTRFEVSQQEVDGVLMPDGGAFSIQPGDKYAVFGCMLPNEYICNDGDHSGAEWDMLRECVRHLYDNEDEHPTITGKVDGIWSKGDWDGIGPRLIPGGFILFTDPRFQPDGLLIRITGVKDYINSPQSPELELSNETVTLGYVAAERSGESDRQVRLSDKMALVESRDVRRSMRVKTRVSAVEDELYGTDELLGVKDVVGTLQEAVESINAALAETVEDVNWLVSESGGGDDSGQSGHTHGGITFDPVDVGGSSGSVRYPDPDGE